MERRALLAFSAIACPLFVGVGLATALSVMEGTGGVSVGFMIGAMSGSVAALIACELKRRNG